MQSPKSARSYTPDALAKLAGVSVRTLHYYDTIGLLPASREENGYRLYCSADAKRLQRIMQLRATGMKLGDISQALDSNSGGSAALLRKQRGRIEAEIERLQGILENIDASITEAEGGKTMSDTERFDAFKRNMVEENEKQYGQEARTLYGDDAVDASNAKLMGMSEDKYKKVQAMEQEMLQNLREAMAQNDPTCEAAKRAFDLHRQWLCAFWKEGSYSPAAHIGLAQMYASDDRFKKSYDDRAGEGAAEFLRDIIVANAAQ